MKQEETYHEKLLSKMDAYAHGVYKITKQFPADEKFGLTSQLRRSALSVVLNYIEGYARGRAKVHKNFLEMSYGSLKESKYLLGFSHEEQYLDGEGFERLDNLANEIGAMLWGTVKNL